MHEHMPATALATRQGVPPPMKKSRLHVSGPKPSAEPLTTQWNIAHWFTRSHGAEKALVLGICDLQTTPYHREVIDAIQKMPTVVRERLVKCLVDGVPVPSDEYGKYMTQLGPREWGTWTAAAVILNYQIIPTAPPEPSTESAAPVPATQAPLASTPQPPASQPPPGRLPLRPPEPAVSIPQFSRALMGQTSAAPRPPPKK